MGCFIACFGSSKHRKHLHHPSPNHHHHHHQIHENCEPAAAISNIIKPVSHSIGKSEKQSNGSIENKVQFDSDVKTSVEEVLKCCVKTEKKDRDKEKEKEGEKVVKQDIVNQQVTKFSQENREREESQNLSDSSMSSMISYPPMHRYHNCTIIDDDDDDKDLEDINSKDNDDHQIHEESSESLFSLSIESRKQVNVTELEEKEEVSSPFTILTPPPEQEINSIGFNQNGRDKSRYLHSVLNPVENLNQWKAVKSRTTPQPLNHQEKENINLEQKPNIPFCEEPSLKSLNHNNSKRKFSHLRPKVQEIEVDTSLSSWLVGSEKTPMSNESSPNSIGNLSSQSRRGNSCTSFEDRPILGALSVEEIKQLSARSTPKRSPPRHSPDEEVAIIGTVGSYWSQTGQTMDSGSTSSYNPKSGSPTKFTKDKTVKCNSTPFAKRLERTLETGIA